MSHKIVPGSNLSYEEEFRIRIIEERVENIEDIIRQLIEKIDISEEEKSKIIDKFPKYIRNIGRQ
jgi:hypothetical protein